MLSCAESKGHRPEDDRVENHVAEADVVVGAVPDMAPEAIQSFDTSNGESQFTETRASEAAVDCPEAPPDQESKKKPEGDPGQDDTPSEQISKPAPNIAFDISGSVQSAYLKQLEDRLRFLEKKLKVGNSTVSEPEDKTGEETDRTEDAKRSDEDDEGSTRSEDESGSEVESRRRRKTLKLSHNRLTSNEWRKMRLNELGRSSINSRMGNHVLDIVTDKGDLAIPQYQLAYENGEIRHYNGLNRVRINSETVIDSLSEIASTFLPTPCILLHPFKVLVDKESEIRSFFECLKAKALEQEADGEENPNEDPKAEPEQDVKDTPKDECQSITGSSELQDKPSFNSQEEFAKVERPQSRKSTGKTPRQDCKFLHFERLVDFMDNDLKPELVRAKSIKEGSAKRILFAHLWHLFPPGEMIISQDPRSDQPCYIYQVVNTSGGRPILQTSISRLNSSDKEADEKYKGKKSAFVIDCFGLDFDGKKFRPVQKAFSIENYSGECAITALDVFPLRYMNQPEQKKIREELMHRGRIFLKLATVNAAHREYTGMALDRDEKEEIDSRVIVDFANAAVLDQKEQGVVDPAKHNRTLRKVFGLRHLSKTDNRELSEYIAYYGTEVSLYDDTLFDTDRRDRLFSENRVLKAPGMALDGDELGDEELLLLPGHVFAYVLRIRDFRKLDVMLIREVNLNKTGFEDLVLPSRHKRLTKALVERHSLGSRPVEHQPGQSAASENFDLVRGKGKGLILLLHGSPGTGKTSTAETIADATGRPLLPVTCGDIGETAAEVEENLERIFSLAHRWGCVLLLDEADVFLSKRRKEDLRRNAVVSVFLRVLEYYSGILFLTTNRVGTIDEAFKSRIHISLYYPPLDWNTTKEIWRVNLRRSKDRVDADEFAILRFAKKHFNSHQGTFRWNGRQIFNAFQTAIALAEFDQEKADGNHRPKLMEEHFSQVAKTSKKFEDYLQEVHGGEDDAQINSMDRVRADLWGVEPSIPTPYPSMKRHKTKSRRKVESSDLPSSSEGGSDDSSDLQSESTEDEQDSSDRGKRRKGKKKSKREESADRKGKSRKGRKDQDKGSAKPKKSKKDPKQTPSSDSDQAQ